MKIFALGVNHKTANVEVREQLAIAPEQLGESVLRLRELAQVEELMMLSTCNRVEIYACGDVTLEQLLESTSALRDVPVSQLREHCFALTGESAIRHIFRVTASLESLVVGEPQILGQVKDAFQLASDVGSIGLVLGRCLTTAFHGAKRVRTETEIAKGGASVPSVAVDLAGRIFGDLKSGKALVVGAGEMARHTAVHLRAAGIGSMVVVNRSEARGRALAQEVEGRYEGWDALDEELRVADIVVASTGSQEPIVDSARMRKIMKARKYAPIFMIDIAVPRDISRDVGELDGVFLYDVDDLRQLVDENLASRHRESEHADQLVEEEMRSFMQWQRERSLGPLIKELRESTMAVATSEVARIMGKLQGLSPEQQKVVQGLAHGIVNKILHRPITQLRASVNHTSTSSPDLVEATRLLFEVGQAELGQSAPDKDSRRL